MICACARLILKSTTHLLTIQWGIARIHKNVLNNQQRMPATIETFDTLNNKTIRCADMRVYICLIKIPSIVQSRWFAKSLRQFQWCWHIECDTNSGMKFVCFVDKFYLVTNTRKKKRINTRNLLDASDDNGRLNYLHRVHLQLIHNFKSDTFRWYGLMYPLFTLIFRFLLAIACLGNSSFSSSANLKNIRLGRVNTINVRICSVFDVNVVYSN